MLLVDSELCGLDCIMESLLGACPLIFLNDNAHSIDATHILFSRLKHVPIALDFPAQKELIIQVPLLNTLPT